MENGWKLNVISLNGLSSKLYHARVIWRVPSLYSRKISFPVCGRVVEAFIYKFEGPCKHNENIWWWTTILFAWPRKYEYLCDTQYWVTSKIFKSQLISIAHVEILKEWYCVWNWLPKERILFKTLRVFYHQFFKWNIEVILPRMKVV